MAIKWEYQGREWSARELSEEFGISECVIRNRINRSNWTVEKAVTTRILSPSEIGRRGKMKSYHNQRARQKKSGWVQNGS